MGLHRLLNCNTYAVVFARYSLHENGFQRDLAVKSIVAINSIDFFFLLSVHIKNPRCLDIFYGVWVYRVKENGRESEREIL